ncbi:putative ATPase [Salmonella phage Astrid]|uniref:Uncharacterized protein n=2 Tax=Astrithrvirus astrithr TaxID=2846123 RepID=A0A6G8R961_9CAUD|nr:hypothetical protein HWD18_gp12 [Salmonella phage astrithr]AZF88305.1 putative ATPase [Salmonella phage Astrid]QIN97950.1 hypothetical protein astrithr_12 [Salmonella phage astrithr]
MGINITRQRLLDGMRSIGEPFTQSEIESICRELFHNRGKISDLKNKLASKSDNKKAP